MNRLYTVEEVIALAARTSSLNTDFQLNPRAIGAIFTLKISAASGTTPTYDLKIQRYDSATATWHDITGAAFAQKTAAGNDQLVVYPGITATANKAVSNVLAKNLRLVETIGGTTPSFTRQVTMEPLA